MLRYEYQEQIKFHSHVQGLVIVNELLANTPDGPRLFGGHVLLPREKGAWPVLRREMRTAIFARVSLPMPDMDEEDIDWLYCAECSICGACFRGAGSKAETDQAYAHAHQHVTSCGAP